MCIWITCCIVNIVSSKEPLYKSEIINLINFLNYFSLFYVDTLYFPTSKEIISPFRGPMSPPVSHTELLQVQQQVVQITAATLEQKKNTFACPTSQTQRKVSGGMRKSFFFNHLFKKWDLSYLRKKFLLSPCITNYSCQSHGALLEII